MTEPLTLLTMLYAAFESPALEPVFRRGSGVQRSDVVRHVAYRVVKVDWDPAWGSVPRLSESVRPGVHRRPVLKHGQRPGVAQIVDRRLDDLHTSAYACHDIVSRAMDGLRLAGSVLRPTDIGEEVAVAVGGYLVDGGSAPQGDAVDAIAAKIVRSHRPTAPRLAAPAFASAFGESFDEQWAERGASNLAASPPSQIGLGRDERPPLIDRTHGDRSWRAGADRSVHSRYAQHFKRSSRTRPRSHHLHRCPADGRAPLGEPGELELARACETYGLHHEAHRVVLRSFFAGTGLEAYDFRPWKVWSTAGCDTIPADEDICDELADAFRSAMSRWWQTRSTAHELKRQFPDLESHLEPIQQAVVRKAWMDLLRREREQVDAARRCHVVTLTKIVLDCGVFDAVRDWLRNGRDTAPDDRRATASWELLAGHREVVVWFRQEDVRWREAYVEAASRSGGTSWQQTFLTVDELLVELARALRTYEEQS